METQEQQQPARATGPGTTAPVPPHGAVQPDGKRKKIIGTVLALALLGGAGIAYYYHYQGVHYVTTEDARVAADLMSVTPQVAGRLASWTVREGDRVEAGQVIGTVDPGVPAGMAAGLTGMPGADASTGADRTSVRAPGTGIVIRSTAVAGSTVAPGQALAYVADPEAFYVSSNIEETRIERIRPGQRVTLRFDAFPGVTLTGRVDSIGLATTSTFALLPAQNASGNFTKVTQRIPVKIALPSAPGVRLLPGMNVTVSIHLQ